MPAPTTELGYVAPWSDFARSGAALMGVPDDPTEHTPELQWPNSVLVYDRMRRQDAQVNAVLLAVTLPLRRPIWHVDPRRAREEVVRLVAEDLDLPILGEDREPPERTRDRFSWSLHLRLLLLSLIYGHMPFEQLYRYDADGMARLRKLAPRFPPTLAAIVVEKDGGLREIRQYEQGRTGSAKPIPVNRLAYYVNGREGAAWQGVSMLRTLYKHWLLKDRLLRVDTQTGERNGMGVPIIEAAQGTNETQMRELQQIASAYRAGEASGGALPYGARLRLLGVEGTLPDLLAKISYHDTAMARGMLAQFLQLGTAQGAAGHRSLGETFVEFFAHSLDSIASDISSVTTQHVVEDLVDHNWGPNEPAPAVVAQPIASEVEMTAEALGSLVRDGVLTRDDPLEGEVRRRLRLPPKPEPEEGPSGDPQVLARAIQQMYLGVGKVVTVEEAREILNRQGAGLAGPGPAPEVEGPMPTIGPIAAARRREVRAAEVGEEYDEAIVAEMARLVDAGAIEATLAAGGTVEEALQAGFEEDPESLAEVLALLWGGAYVAGAAAAAPALPGAVPVARPANLREQVRPIAEGIISTLRGRVQAGVVSATEAGFEGSTLISLLDEIAKDPAAGRLIAVTETRRAAVAGAAATWQAAGVEDLRWRVNGANPCEVCAPRADTVQSEEGWDLPPAHPRCGCSPEPV